MQLPALLLTYAAQAVLEGGFSLFEFQVNSRSVHSIPFPPTSLYVPFPPSTLTYYFDSNLNKLLFRSFSLNVLKALHYIARSLKTIAVPDEQWL